MEKFIKFFFKKKFLSFRQYFFPKFRVFSDFFKVLRIENKDIFFGYYDLNPFSLNSDLILCHSVKKNSKYAEIVVFNLNETKKTEVFDKTNAWSWQLGARLRWLNNSRCIGFNFLEKDKGSFKIINIKSRKEKIIKFPIFDINEKKMLGLSINFSVLEKFRPGYGFFHKEKENNIKLISLKNSTIKLKIEAKQLLNCLKINKVKCFYFNHLQFSKCGYFFSFFFIYKIDKNFKSTLFVYDSKKKIFFPITTSIEVPSQYFWVSSNKIIITIVKDKIVNYYEYDLKKKRKYILSYFPKNNDGHPSVNPKNKNLIVTDTYPDRLGNQTLLVINKKKKKYKSIAYFFNPENYYGKNKCDLHPRWSTCGKKICCDTAFNDKREMFIIDTNC